MKLPALILFMLPVWVLAQDITGVWTGYIKTPGSQLEYELVISNGGKWLNGYSLIIYPKDGIENIGIKKAKIRQSKKEIYFEDGELVYDNFTTQPRKVKMYGNLSLIMKDSLMTLQGNFSTRSLDFRDMRTYQGEVYLKRSGTPLSSKTVITLDEINFPANFSFPSNKEIKKTLPVPGKKKPADRSVITSPIKLSDRKIEKISELFFTSDSLVLSVYDNGTIDGDTISIALNGKIINEKIALTAKAFKIVIPSHIATGDSLTLVMHAESLGLIPPNSGLLIVEDGTTRHVVRFTGDLQKSSAIVFKRKRQ